MAGGAYELLPKYIGSFGMCPIHEGVSRGI
jgi:hypothetical protein